MGWLNNYQQQQQQQTQYQGGIWDFLSVLEVFVARPVSESH